MVTGPDADSGSHPGDHSAAIKTATRIDHPLLKVAYDVSNAEFVGEDQVEALRQLAPWLGQVHLSDGTATRWRHDRVGAGTVRFAEILRVLDEIGFDGVHVLEIISSTPLEDMAASQRTLAEIAWAE